MKLEHTMSPNKSQQQPAQGTRLLPDISDDISVVSGTKKPLSLLKVQGSIQEEQFENENSSDLFIVPDNQMREQLQLEIEKLRESNSLFFTKMMEAYRVEKANNSNLTSTNEFVTRVKAELEQQNIDLEKKVANLEKNLTINQKKIGKVGLIH